MQSSRAQRRLHLLRPRAQPQASPQARRWASPRISTPFRSSLRARASSLQLHRSRVEVTRRLQPQHRLPSRHSPAVQTAHRMPSPYCAATQRAPLRRTRFSRELSTAAGAWLSGAWASHHLRACPAATARGQPPPASPCPRARRRAPSAPSNCTSARMCNRWLALRQRHSTPPPRRGAGCRRRCSRARHRVQSATRAACRFSRALCRCARTVCPDLQLATPDSACRSSSPPQPCCMCGVAEQSDTSYS